MKKLLLFMLLSILVLSCEKDEGVFVPNVEQNVEVRVKKDKVQICHQLGNGQFNLIEVNGNAEQAHLNHGDGKPGSCYNEEGLFMSEACKLIPVYDVVDVCDDLDNNCNGTIDEGVEEVCNGIDDDCDDIIDEGFDQDEDGWTSCEGDCDDTNISVFPGATEICGDGVDQDCNGEDELCPSNCSGNLCEYLPNGDISNISNSSLCYVPWFGEDFCGPGLHYDYLWFSTQIDNADIYLSVQGYFEDNCGYPYGYLDYIYYDYNTSIYKSFSVDCDDSGGTQNEAHSCPDLTGFMHALAQMLLDAGVDNPCGLRSAPGKIIERLEDVNKFKPFIDKSLRSS